MRIATFEFDVRVRDVAGNLEQVTRAVRLAAEGGAELLSLPEMWPTSFAADADDALFAENDAAVDHVRELSRDHGVVVIGTAFHAEQRPPTNRAHVLDRGELRAGHDKVHLFTPTAEHLAFTGGDAPPRALDVETSAGTVKLATLVCYDLRFPDVARAAFRGGAEMLVVSAQWPETRVSHWDALVRGRAAEMLGYVVANNRVGTDLIGRRKLELTFPGHSFVAGPDGDVEPDRTEILPRDGCADGVLRFHELDLERTRKLRRTVPVDRDERTDVLASWMEPGKGR